MTPQEHGVESLEPPSFGQFQAFNPCSATVRPVILSFEWSAKPQFKSSQGFAQPGRLASKILQRFCSFFALALQQRRSCFCSWTHAQVSILYLRLPLDAL